MANPRELFTPDNMTLMLVEHLENEHVLTEEAVAAMYAAAAAAEFSYSHLTTLLIHTPEGAPAANEVVLLPDLVPDEVDKGGGASTSEAAAGVVPTSSDPPRPVLNTARLLVVQILAPKLGPLTPSQVIAVLNFFDPESYLRAQVVSLLSRPLGTLADVAAAVALVEAVPRATRAAVVRVVGAMLAQPLAVHTAVELCRAVPKSSNARVAAIAAVQPFLETPLSHASLLTLMELLPDEGPPRARALELLIPHAVSLDYREAAAVVAAVPPEGHLRLRVLCSVRRFNVAQVQATASLPEFAPPASDAAPLIDAAVPGLTDVLPEVAALVNTVQPVGDRVKAVPFLVRLGLRPRWELAHTLVSAQADNAPHRTGLLLAVAAAVDPRLHPLSGDEVVSLVRRVRAEDRPEVLTALVGKISAAGGPVFDYAAVLVILESVRESYSHRLSAFATVAPLMEPLTVAEFVGVIESFSKQRLGAAEVFLSSGCPITDLSPTDSTAAVLGLFDRKERAAVAAMFGLVVET